MAGCASLGFVTASARRRYTYPAYLDLDEMSNVKLEYLDGEIFAMAGGTPDHAALAMNIGIALAAVREHGCRVFSSDLRIRVLATGLAAYPDVTIVCGPAQYDPDSRTTITNPTIIVEVLSDSTRDYDRGAKAEHYRQIGSLKACLLVSHQQPQIEAWRRADDGSWSRSEHGPGAVIELPGIDVALPVDEVYRGGLTGAG
jgi:Uma2 family endonuclease